MARGPRHLIAHPLLFVLFPILSVYASNLQEVRARELVMPIVVAWAVVLTLWGLARLVMPGVRGAAIIASALGVALVAHGHMVRVMQLALGAWGQRVLLPIIAGLLVVLVVLLRRRRDVDLVTFTRALNGFAVALVCMPLISVAVAGRPGPAPASFSFGPAIDLPAPAKKPDIYYIILDGYGRADVLQQLFGHDNQPFLDELRGMGFFVAPRATANYSQTLLSLCSSLNGEYLDALQDRRVPRGELIKPIEQSRVFTALKRHGYELVCFEKNYLTNARGVDVLVGRKAWVTQFQALLLDSSAMRVLFDMNVLPRLNQTLDTWSYDYHRWQVLNVLDNLDRFAGDGRAQLVFAHVLSPHPPFIFDEHGTYRPPAKPYGLFDGSHFHPVPEDPREYVNGYRAQVRFLNGRLEPILRRIIAKSEVPPVIILQGDHGPGSQLDWDNAAASNMGERLSILNAIYLGDAATDGLPAGLSPVNNFRVVFNRCFGADLPMLETRNLYSRWASPFYFQDVTVEVQKEKR